MDSSRRVLLALEAMTLSRFRFVLFLLAASAAHAQAPVPAAAGFSTVFEGSAGYEYVNFGFPDGSREDLHGADISLTAHIRPKFSLRVDGSYALGQNPLGRGNHPSVLGYMGGPVYYPLQHNGISLYGQALFGGALVSGTVPAAGGGFFTGRLNRFAWAAGMGVQLKDTSAISYRIGADYLRASFVNSIPQIQAGNSYRVVASVVYVFGRRSRVFR